MTRCSVCEAETTVSDACPHCGTLVCSAHRRPSAHDCSGTPGGETDGWRLDLDRPVSAGSDDRSRPSLLRAGATLAVLSFVLVAVAVGAVVYADGLDDGLDPTVVEQRIVAESNAERLDDGVGEATHDSELAAVARSHSEDMRDRGFVDHTDPDGIEPEDRTRAAGLDCLPGENIYQTPRGALVTDDGAFAAQVVRSWMDSPGHRDTVLRERYTRQGVGVAVGEDAVYVTQLFC